MPAPTMPPIPPAEREAVRYLLLTGGAFRGGVQYWPMVELLKLHDYAAIYGVSVGSINGAMGAQGKLEELLAFWNDVDGLSGFLRFRWLYVLLWVTGILKLLEFFGLHRVGGFYSMKPLRKKLEEFIVLRDFEVPFVAGVVSANTGKYHSIDTRTSSDVSQVRVAIEAGSCMAPIMQPPTIHLDGVDDLGIDGGFRNIIPIPHNEIYEARAGGKKVVVDVIACTPIERLSRKATQKIDGSLELGLRGLSVMEAEVFANDLLQLQKAVGSLGCVNVYAPSHDTGESFQADRETIQARLAEGKRMWERGPQVLKGVG